MTFVLGDRVLETTITTLTGNITLAGAVSGYVAFSSVATVNGDTFYYQISGGTEWEVGIGTRVDATHFARTTVLASSNAGALVSFSAGTKEVWMDATADMLRNAINTNPNPNVVNGSILATVSANAVTFALRTAAGNVPTAADPVFLVFQKSNGQQSAVIRVTAALTITVSSGSTLGGVNNSPIRVWLAVLLNGSTPELIVRNCMLQFGPGNGGGIIQGFPNNGVITTTALAGAGADDSARVSYSVTARTAVPFLILGHFDWDDTPLVTAGTWANGPDKSVMWSPSVPLPGTVVQIEANSNTTQQNATTTTLLQIVGRSITRLSKCNAIEVIGGNCDVLTTNSGGQARVFVANTTQGYLMNFVDFLQSSGVNGNTIWPCHTWTYDHPGSVNPNNYVLEIQLVGGTGTASCPATGSNAWIVLKELQG